MGIPCPSDIELVEVTNSSDARRLTQIVNCTGGSGSFIVLWTGRILINATLDISNGTSLNITGLDGGVIDGGGVVQLFNVSSSTLSLSNLALEHGNATNGGAIQASASDIIVTDCNITANSGTDSGGALSLEDSTLFFGGNVTFQSNRAIFQGGAVYAVSSWVTLGGTAQFENNNVSERGAALSLEFSMLNLTGESYFVNNAAEVSGGSIHGINSIMNVSGQEAYAYFAGNVAVAGFGGALYWRGNDASISIEAPSYFVNNSGPTAGALYLSGRGLQAFLSETVFESNVAHKSGGALVTHSIGLSSSYSVVQGCVFDGNKARIDGGAILASSGYISLQDSIFRHNIADDSGGGIFTDGGYTHSAMTVARTELSYNQASTGPAIAQLGKTEDFAAQDVTFDGVTFTGNTLLCPDGDFLDQDTNETIAEEHMAYITACSSCSNFTACVNCTVTDVDTVAFCSPVPEHTLSPDRDGTLASLELDAGYWRVSNASSKIFRCYNEDACAGGVAEMCGDVNCEDGYCAEGYTGPYCAVCASGYSEGQNKRCHLCGGASSQAAEAVGIAGLVIFTFLLLCAFKYLTSAGQAQAQAQGKGRENGRDEETPGSRKDLSRVVQVIPFQALKIIVVAWQITTEFASVANVTFPLIYRNFLYVIEVVGLDLTSLLSFGCLIKTDFFDHLLVVTISPLVVLASLGVTFWVARRRYGRQASEMAEIRRKHLSALVLITYLVYSPVSSVVFQTFACDTLDNGYSYLRADYRILCRDSSGKANPRHVGFMLYAGLMGLLYPLGIPGLYAVVLFMGWKQRARRQPVVLEEPSRLSSAFTWSLSGAVDSFSVEEYEEQSNSDDHIRTCGVDDMVRDLSKPYRTDRSYYEVVECIRRVMLTGVVVFVFPDSVAQVSITFLLALLFYAVAEAQNPYESTQNSWMSRLGHLIVLLSMFTALLLKSDFTDEPNTGKELFSVILVVANVMMIVAVFAQSILTFFVEVLDE